MDLRPNTRAKSMELEEAIYSIPEKKPRLRQRSKPPSLSSDRLYQSGITHPPNGEADCATVWGGDPPNEISRLERAENEDSLAIHYGLIVLANQLIRTFSLG